jgi:hypothetical protein
MVDNKAEEGLTTRRKNRLLLANLKRRFITPVKNCVSFLHQKIIKPDWYNLRSIKPIARKFGFYRGQPIDRYYIEQFLENSQLFINGRILEVADDGYSRKFGRHIQSIHILHVNSKNPKATIIGDLSKLETLPKDFFDCFICTQTLQFIYDVSKAIRGIYQMLKKDGVVLATVPGIAQISRDDNKRWGDYWRFTELSLFKSFSAVFDKENVEVESYGNVLSSIAFLEGLCVTELTTQELDYKDPDYQMLLTVVAKKIVSEPAHG